MPRGWLPFVLTLLIASPAAAVFGTSDNVPAATLLYPYFEVDLNDNQGATTIIAFQSASASAVLTKVILWTDASVPVLNFHVYLTGYDVVTINVRDVLAGNLPVSATDGQDPSDVISPQGSFSQDLNYPSCAGFTPPPTLNATAIADLRAALTGNAMSTGKCAGFARGDGVARGYITVDAVLSCSTLTPHDPQYFATDSTRIASETNYLVGDYFFIEPANNFAQGERAVHIEASQSNLTPGDYSFYGRYVAFGGTDRREPLPVQWGAHYTSGQTNLIAWRDAKAQQNPFTCVVMPSWYPLSAQQIVVFDVQENPASVGQETPVLPLETGRVDVGPGSQLPTTAKMGWVFLDLHHVVLSDLTNTSQSWVLKVDSPEDVGIFSTLVPATFFPRP